MMMATEFFRLRGSATIAWNSLGGHSVRMGVLGFGKTGKTIVNRVLQDPGANLEWVLRWSAEHAGMFASEVLNLPMKRGTIYSRQNVDADHFLGSHPVDVIIDFSSRSSVDLYGIAARRGIRIVSAISNYGEEHLLQLRRASKQTAVLYSPNISVGVNILMCLAESLQKVLPQVDIEIIEEHFREKKDMSGTAVRIARRLGLDENRHVNSIRAGGIVGRHEILFGLQDQTIRLVHESISRNAFAEGAMYAARWLADKSAGYYTMEQALGFHRVEGPKLTQSDALTASLS